MARTHGHAGQAGKARTPTYHSWQSMVARCTRPTHMYWPIYGGRGITVSPRWLKSFPTFLADMGERPAGMTLDRIDPNGNYTPENCRWATAKQQRHNRRDARAQAELFADCILSPTRPLEPAPDMPF